MQTLTVMQHNLVAKVYASGSHYHVHKDHPGIDALFKNGYLQKVHKHQYKNHWIVGVDEVGLQYVEQRRTQR